MSSIVDIVILLSLYILYSLSINVVHCIQLTMNVTLIMMMMMNCIHVEL